MYNKIHFNRVSKYIVGILIKVILNSNILTNNLYITN